MRSFQKNLHVYTVDRVTIEVVLTAPQRYVSICCCCWRTPHSFQEESMSDTCVDHASLFLNMPDHSARHLCQPGLPGLHSEPLLWSVNISKRETLPFSLRYSILSIQHRKIQHNHFRCTCPSPFSLPIDSTASLPPPKPHIHGSSGRDIPRLSTDLDSYQAFFYQPALKGEAWPILPQFEPHSSVGTVDRSDLHAFPSHSPLLI